MTIFKKNSANHGLLIVYFRLLKQTLQFLQQINVKNVHSVSGPGIWTHNLLIRVSSLIHYTRAPAHVVSNSYEALSALPIYLYTYSPTYLTKSLWKRVVRKSLVMMRLGRHDEGSTYSSWRNLWHQHSTGYCWMYLNPKEHTLCVSKIRLFNWRFIN